MLLKTMCHIFPVPTIVHVLLVTYEAHPPLAHLTELSVKELGFTQVLS
jgi:hypothetical protein